MLEPEIEQINLGIAEVLKVFYTGKVDMVVGCKVISGKLQNNAKIAVIRDDAGVGAGECTELKIVKEDVQEVEKGGECGVKFKGKFKLEEGDILSFYKEEQRIKTL